MLRPSASVISRIFHIAKLATTCTLLLNHQVLASGQAGAASVKVEDVKVGPADYAFSQKSSRVSDLIKLFQSIDEAAERGNCKPNDNVMISLTEAALKLHSLSSGLPLRVKCSKYVKLISLPNIRTYATVNLLMREELHLSEIEQTDVSPMTTLISARKYDALGKIQTIMQSLDSERENLKSTYEPKVQKDLLDCVNYFIYRHQKATVGMTGLVRDSLLKLSPSLVQQSDVKQNLMKFDDSIRRIKQIESDETKSGSSDVGAWLDELTKVYRMIQSDEYEVPKVVRNFVGDPKRLQRLEEYNEIVETAHRNTKRLLTLESNHKDQSEDYKKLAYETSYLIETNKVLIPEPIYQFIQEPRRQQIISEYADLTQKRETQSSTTETTNRESQQIVTKHTDRTAMEQLKLKNYCVRLARELDSYSRSFTLKGLDANVVRAFSSRVERFKNDCLLGNGKALDTDSLIQQSRWPIISVTVKLSSWCSRKLGNNPSDRRVSLVHSQDRDTTVKECSRVTSQYRELANYLFNQLSNNN